MPATPWSQWFDGRQAVQTLPQDCIKDCSSAGPVDEPVSYWVERLNFQAPSWYVRDYLGGMGAWDSAELANHRDNLKRLLWIWACDCKEYSDPDYLVYLG